MKPWTEISRERVFDTYTKIDKIIYEFPDGSRHDFYVKRQSRAACILALTDDNRVIMAEQYRPGPNKVLLELPGGVVEDGEDRLAGAERELREETGYSGRVEFVTDCYDDAYVDTVRSCFVARGCRRTDVQELDVAEAINVRLVPLEDFKQLLRRGQLTDVEVGFLGLDYLGLL